MQMKAMSTFRCANGDYVLLPPSTTTAPADAGEVTPLLGRVTCGHLDLEVQREIARQLTQHGFARISRAAFFGPSVQL
jgi:hypothetical protein